MIIVLHDDGCFEQHEHPDSIRGFLKFCYDAIPCDLVCRVGLSPTMDMWLDDDGMYTQDINPYATKLANDYGYPADMLFGAAVITGIEYTENGPGSSNLSDRDFDQITGWIGRNRNASEMSVYVVQS